MYYVQIFYRYSAKPNCECGPTALAAAEAAAQQQSCHTEPHQYRIIPATDIYIWIICTKCSQRCEIFNICHELRIHREYRIQPHSSAHSWPRNIYLLITLFNTLFGLGCIFEGYDFRSTIRITYKQDSIPTETMASSSVSQEDVENDFEKLEKRSRIRTARARQINPQVRMVISAV